MCRRLKAELDDLVGYLLKKKIHETEFHQNGFGELLGCGGVC